MKRIHVCSFTVLGEPASAKNQRQIVTINHRPAVIKSAKARGYANAVRLQVRQLHPLLTGDVCLRMDFYYASRRPDLCDDALIDAMQNRIYENDRQIKEKHLYHHIDRLNPRVEVQVFVLAKDDEQA
jgi:Holliday junction resolvase RusA-like endonuclease